MSRFPSPTLADRIDGRIQELEDGFVRLGDEDTPFTLQGGRESVEEIQQLHTERSLIGAMSSTAHLKTDVPVLETLYSGLGWGGSCFRKCHINQGC